MFGGFYFKWPNNATTMANTSVFIMCNESWSIT